MLCKETLELVTGFVDDELSAQEQTLFEEHLAACDGCTEAVSRERGLKARLRDVGQSVIAPVELRVALERKYGVHPQERRLRVADWLRMSVRPVPAMALLLLLVVPAALLVLEFSQAISVETLETHEAVVSGAFPYARSNSPRTVAEELSRSVGGRFVPPAYDLGQYGLHTVGGFQQKVGDREVLVTVYEGKTNPLTCHTFLGDENDVPDSARVIYDPVDGRKYFTFSDGSVNGVLQRYGDEICVLVSKMPMDDLVRIARSVQHHKHS